MFRNPDIQLTETRGICFGKQQKILENVGKTEKNLQKGADTKRNEGDKTSVFITYQSEICDAVR